VKAVARLRARAAFFTVRLADATTAASKTAMPLPPVFWTVTYASAEVLPAPGATADGDARGSDEPSIREGPRRVGNDRCWSPASEARGRGQVGQALAGSGVSEIGHALVVIVELAGRAPAAPRSRRSATVWHDAPPMMICVPAAAKAHGLQRARHRT